MRFKRLELAMYTIQEYLKIYIMSLKVLFNRNEQLVDVQSELHRQE